MAPLSGKLAAFGRATTWVAEQKEALIDWAGGLQVGGQRCAAEIRVYDSGSTVAGAAKSAVQALAVDQVDFLIAQGSCDNTIAPAALCEEFEKPCVTAFWPGEAWLLGSDRHPIERDFANHIAFSVREALETRVDTLSAIPGGFNGRVGYLFPNEKGAMTFAKLIDPMIRANEWEPVDTGRFDVSLPDHGAVIDSFNLNQMEIVIGAMTPPELVRLPKQAAERGLSPKAYAVEKATMSQEHVAGFGVLGANLIGAQHWGPDFPGRSAFGGYSGQELVQRYARSHPQDPYPAPDMAAFDDAALDIALEAFAHASSTDPFDVADALRDMQFDTLVGEVHFSGHGNAQTPTADAQWRMNGSTGGLARVTINSVLYPEIPKAPDIRLYRVR